MGTMRHSTAQSLCMASRLLLLALLVLSATAGDLPDPALAFSLGTPPVPYNLYAGVPAGFPSICRNTGYRTDCNQMWVEPADSPGVVLLLATREAYWSYGLWNSASENDEARGIIYTHCLDEQKLQQLLVLVLQETAELTLVVFVNITDQDSVQQEAPRFGVQIPAATIRGLSRIGANTFVTRYMNEALHCQDRRAASNLTGAWVGIALGSVVGLLVGMCMCAMCVGTVTGEEGVKCRASCRVSCRRLCPLSPPPSSASSAGAAAAAAVPAPLPGPSSVPEDPLAAPAQSGLLVAGDGSTAEAVADEAAVHIHFE